MRIGGMALGYAAIVWLNRSAGPSALGQYLFLLNSVIVVGPLAALGLPTLVQRLTAPGWTRAASARARGWCYAGAGRGLWQWPRQVPRCCWR